MKGALQPLFGRVAEFWYAVVMPRYHDLQPREQQLVVAAALLLPLIILLFGLLLPAQDARNAQAARLVALQNQLKTANQLADKLEQTVDIPVPTNVLAAVEKLARAHAVRSFMTRIKPQTDLSGHQKLLLQMKQAPFAKVVHFIDGVTKRGLVIDQIKLQATKTPATVNMRMVLAQ